MTKDNKKVLFTNEILYERNISDRVWPAFLDAQIKSDLSGALLATKNYYLLTQQWYPSKSKDIIARIRAVKIASGKAATIREQEIHVKMNEKAWVDIETIWCDISTYLENYGIFKRNFTPDSTSMALPMR